MTLVRQRALASAAMAVVCVLTSTVTGPSAQAMSAALYFRAPVHAGQAYASGDGYWDADLYAKVNSVRIGTLYPGQPALYATVTLSTRNQFKPTNRTDPTQLRFATTKRFTAGQRRKWCATTTRDGYCILKPTITVEAAVGNGDPSLCEVGDQDTAAVTFGESGCRVQIKANGGAAPAGLSRNQLGIFWELDNRPGIFRRLTAHR